MCAGKIPDYQISALLMTIYFNGMLVSERGFLTKAMANSGLKMDFSFRKGPKIDKHSSGGIGDKTSLIIAPLMA